MEKEQLDEEEERIKNQAQVGTKDYIQRMSMCVNQRLYTKDEYVCVSKIINKGWVCVCTKDYIQRMSLCVYQRLYTKDEYVCEPKIIYKWWVCV